MEEIKVARENTVILRYFLSSSIGIFASAKPDTVRITTAPSINWSPYLERKARDGENIDVFIAGHPWELNFLLHQIKQLYAQYTETCIFLSIRSVMKQMTAPVHRLKFTEMVIADLLMRKPFAEN